MKKILLMASAVFAMSASFAQLGDNAFQDDFASTDEYGDSTGGIFWWGKDALGGTQDPNFKATWVRAEGSVTYTVTQGFNEYVPFGLGFGGPEATPKTIDISADQTYKMTVKNDGDSTILVRLAAKDVNENLVDTDSKWNDGDIEGNAWKYVIDIKLEAGATGTIEAGSSNGSGAPEGEMSGTFEGAYYAAYPGPTRDSSFDATVLNGVNITVINANNTGAAASGPQYAPYGLTDYPVTISYISVGDVSSIDTGIGFDELLNSNNSFAVFPNPVTGSVINFEENKENIQIFNAQGTLVNSISSAKSVNISSLDKGFYLIHTDAGYANFIVE